MGRKAFFVESKLTVYDWATCDKCGLKIKEVQDGMSFWNPNPRARDRNICRNCYDVWRHERKEGWERWREKHEALEHAEPSRGQEIERGGRRRHDGKRETDENC